MFVESCSRNSITPQGRSNKIFYKHLPFDKSFFFNDIHTFGAEVDFCENVTYTTTILTVYICVCVYICLMNVAFTNRNLMSFVFPAYNCRSENKTVRSNAPVRTRYIAPFPPILPPIRFVNY